MVVIISAFSIWALSGNSNAKGSDDKNKLYAASVINDGAKLKLAFDIQIINGGKVGKKTDNQTKYITYTKVDTNNPYNMYGAKNGIKQFDMNNNIFRDDLPDGKGLFVYSGAYFKGNVGTNETDAAILLFNIKDSICKMINQINNGTDILPIFNGNINEQPGSWDAALMYEEIDLTPISATSGWTSGCFNMNGVLDHSVYFRILKVN